MGDKGQASFGAAPALSAIFQSVTSIPNNIMKCHLGRSLETVKALAWTALACGTQGRNFEEGGGGGCLLVVQS